MPQPRSRNDVADLERFRGDGDESDPALSSSDAGEGEEGEEEQRSSRKARSFASASESSNQTVPSSAGLEEWLVSSVA